MTNLKFQIRPASVADIPVIMQLIRDLATYERAPNDVTATHSGSFVFSSEPFLNSAFGTRVRAIAIISGEISTPKT